MPRPLLTASVERSFLLTQRLLTRHLLLQEFMPDLPLLQKAGLRQRREGRTGVRFLKPLPGEPIGEDSEESILPVITESGVEPEEPERVYRAPEREAPSPPALETPLQHELEREAEETVASSPVQSPAPVPLPATAPSTAQPEEAEAAPRVRRPWRQRIAEVDVRTEAQPTEVFSPSVEAIPPIEESETPLEASQAVLVSSVVEQPLPATTLPIQNRQERLPEAVEERPIRVEAVADRGESGEDTTRDAIEQQLSEEADRENRTPVAAIETLERPSPSSFQEEKPKTDVFQSFAVEEPRAVEEAEEADPDRAAVTAETLFVDTGQDRSPQSWIARLTGAQKPASSPTVSSVNPLPVKTQETVRPTSGEPTAPPLSPPSSEETPLRETSRRFLQPLVGIDPAVARIYQGPVAEQAAATLHADAITQGNAVFLGAGQGEGTPKGLGVLAHELTHVARNRTPDFVPPIARPAVEPQAPEQPVTVQPSGDEEGLALHVEAQVRAAVEQTREITSTSFIEPPARSVESEVVSDSAPLQRREAPLSEDPISPQGEVTWGGLPAPWEPLPEWVAPSAANFAPVNAPTVPWASAPSAASAEIQRAGEERSVQAPAETGGVTEALPATTPEADLDRLAQQVYARLKQRLSAERRREWR